MDGASKCSPAAAVPVRTKIPDPMIAPMPSAVSDHGPRVFRSRCSGWSASEIKLSMDLQQKSWLSDVRMDVRVVLSDGPGAVSGKRLMSPEVQGGSRYQHRHSAGKFSPAESQVLIPNAKCCLTAWLCHAPASSLCSSSIRARNPAASKDSRLCASCARCVSVSCVRLWSILLYLP